MRQLDGLVLLQLTDLAGTIRRLEAPLPAGIRLRVAGPESDLPLIAELYDAAFGPNHEGKATAAEVARLGQHPRLDPKGVFLAFDRGLAVGLGVGSVDVPAAGAESQSRPGAESRSRPGEVTRQGAIELLAVRPEYRRRGIGRALLHAVLVWLAGRGVVTVVASSEDPLVLELLKKHGFRPPES